jgi:hypothetical protein
MIKKTKKSPSVASKLPVLDDASLARVSGGRKRFGGAAHDDRVGAGALPKDWDQFPELRCRCR